MHIAIESPNQADVIALIAELDAYQDTLYPAEARYALDLASLCQPNVYFVVAREACGTAVGCGAVVLCDGFAEIKRMYVSPRARGQGVARSIIQALEASASIAGYQILTLETGPYQSAALAFYTQQGYERCGPFGSYPEHPLSVFMTKTLAC